MVYLQIIIIFILIFIYIIIQLQLYNNITICLCTIGKKENLYVREYVNYYSNLGIDKLFIYDNNDKNDERFDLVLKDYIENGFVKIIDFRGQLAVQTEAMEECRKNNYKNFDWLMFFDMDEYLFLRNYSSIKVFLDQKIFSKCERIQFNWFIHTDNNLIYYDNRSLLERFSEKKHIYNNKQLRGSNVIKSIIRGNIDIKLINIHYINSNLISCDGFGKIQKIYGIKTNESDHFFYYIDHYWSKSTEEFVNKLLKGDVVLGYNNRENNMKRIRMYFSYNKITEDRVN